MLPRRKSEIMINNILEAMGRTPLIKLNRIVPEGSAQVLVKYEGLNVGGSIKTRTAFAMIEAAEREGKIGPNTIIAEPTSGNQGIGLSLVGAVRGYKVVIVMPDSVSEERVKLMKQYGADVRLVHDEGNIGECIDRCIENSETALSASEMLRSAACAARFPRPDRTKWTIASVSFTKACRAMVIMMISWCARPESAVSVSARRKPRR